MPSANRNISRIDIDKGRTGTHGWEVRITRRGRRVAKYFSDKDYSGKRASLAAAKRFRDEQIEKLRPYTRLELVKRAENRSGNVPGVRLRENVVEKNGWQYTYKTWEASWTPAQGGKRVKRQFSVNKYGEEQAYKLAVKARRQALRDLEKNSA
ncbi:MAG: AP2/ERF family transcription factor [Verrucomicrobiales bacterium]